MLRQLGVQTVKVAVYFSCLQISRTKEASRPQKHRLIRILPKVFLQVRSVIRPLCFVFLVTVRKTPTETFYECLSLEYSEFRKALFTTR